MKVEDDGKSVAGGGELFEVDKDGTNKRVDIGGERTVPDDIVEERLRDE